VEAETKNKSRRIKWIAGTLIGITVIFLGFIILINSVVEPFLKDRLIAEFGIISKQDATLEIPDLDIGLFPPSVVIDGLFLTPGLGVSDRLKDHPVLESKIESISAKGVSLWGLLTDGNLSVRETLISGAEIHFSSGLLDRLSGNGRSSGDSSRSVVLNSLTLAGASLTMYQEDLSSVKSHITLADLNVTDLNLSTGDIRMADRFEQFSFGIDSIRHTTEDRLYRFEMDRILFSSDLGSLTTEGFNLKPQLPAREMPKQIGHEIDHIEIETGSIDLKNLDIHAWLTNGAIKAKSITVESPRVKISRDKNPPDKPVNIRPLLNTQFAHLPMLVSLDTLTVRNGFVSYREWREEQDTSGTLFFDSVEMVMTGLQNSEPDQTVHAEVSSLFMNASKLSVQFEFTLNDDGAQTITGQMEGLDLLKLNPVLVPLAFVRIDRGVIHSVAFKFDLNETVASGEFMCLYDDFSMSLLSKRSLESSLGNRIVSFLANNLQVQSSNHEADPRTGEIYFEKEEGQSMVNYWWKSLRSGIKDLMQRM
jgi:hypothetical protein